MRLLMPLLLSCATVSVWSATDVSRAWIRRLDAVFGQFGITPKALAIEMGLTERQIYDQLALRCPMQAPRLEEVWANHPDAYDAYCIGHLTARGYYCFRESALTRALEHLLDGEKRMVKMDLHGRQRAS